MNAMQQQDRLYQRLTKAHEAAAKRGRGNPAPDEEPTPDQLKFWSHLSPTERLNAYREWKEQRARMASQG